MFKNPSFLFDIICTVVWLLLAVRYARKGFLASVVQLTGSLISLFGARAFSGWAAGQVFERCLAAHGVPDEQRPDLRLAYRETVASFLEEDPHA